MLTDKVAIVTGGARGTGAGIARVLAAQGARVAVLDLDGTEAETTAAALASPGLALACDVAVEDDVTAAVRTVVERLGGLDVLVNNAGVGRGPVDPTGARPRRRRSGHGQHVGGGVGRAALAEPPDDVRDDEGRGAPPEGSPGRGDRQHRLDRRAWSARRDCPPTRQRRPASSR